MDHQILGAPVAGFPPNVERVYLGGRWVGFVYFDWDTEDGTWMIRHTASHAVESRQEGIRTIVDYGRANPDHELREAPAVDARVRAPGSA